MNKEELLKSSGIEVVISNRTKATLLYAVPFSSKIKSRWLILVKSVEEDINPKGVKDIFRHISYDIDGDEWHCDLPQWFGYDKRWGTDEGYAFYKATKEQRIFIVNKLTEKGLKFVRPLNRLIKRT